MNAPIREAEALDALYATAHWLVTDKRYPDAVRVFHAMLTCAPQDERAWIGLGACHEELGNLSVAQRIYRNGRLALHKSTRCEIASARLARRMGLEDEAADAYAVASVLAEEKGEADLTELIANEERSVL